MTRTRVYPTAGREYGREWEETKRRFRDAWWTRNRCFWCWRKWPRVRTEVHHLTYKFGTDVPTIRILFWSYRPLWVFRPLCTTCHHIETKVTRVLFGEPGRKRGWLSGRRHWWDHVLVTYLGRWTLRGVPVLALVAGLYALGLVGR